MKFKPLLASCLLLSVLVTPAVLADDMYVCTEEVSVSAESVINYWTEERMKNAIPYPMHSPKGIPMLRPAGTIPVPADGEPGSRPGGYPKSKESLLSKEIGSPELLPLVEPLGDERTPGDHGYPFPFPFTRYEVLSSLYKTYPYRTIGKVFFTEGSQNFVCSGSSIGGRKVLTAGHCVSDGSGNFHTNWAFAPAYRDGNRPYGTWAAYKLCTFTAWHNSGEWCRDVGVAVVRDKNGRMLSQRVGWLGFAWNLDSEHMHWNLFGYPAEGANFNGERMIQCEASFARWTAAWWDQDCVPLPQCVGCDMTGGCSGGPWIRHFKPGVVGATNYANSVNSTFYLDNRVAGGLCGPYFDGIESGTVHWLVFTFCTE